MSATLWSPDQPPPERASADPLGCACLGVVAVAIGGILVLVIAVWASWYFNAAHTITRRVADAQLPYVELVDYNIDVTLYETVAIYLTADVTDAQMADLYCRIVTPATASGVRHFVMEKGVHWGPPPPPPDDLMRYGYYGGTTVEPPACP